MIVITVLGFTAEFVIRPLTEHKLKDIEKVILITTESEDPLSSERARKTLDEVIRTLSMMNVNYKICKININKNFDDIVKYISQCLRGEKSQWLVYIIGGMRLLNLALYYYSLLARSLGKDIVVKSYTEDYRVSTDVPVTLPHIPKGKEWVDVLRVFEIIHSLEEASDILGKSTSTVSKQVKSIEELLECKRKEKEKVCKINSMGEVVLNILDSI